MPSERILDLADCTEFRHSLQARPPAIVHGTVVLLVALLATALVWAAATKADLVVRAAGRVRPVSTPKKVFNAGRGEVLSATVGGKVVEVNFQEGAAVQQGDVLVRLDTERLDNECAKRLRTIQAGEEELGKISRLEELLSRQFDAARAKAEAELAQARDELRQAKERQASDVRLAELELKSVEDDEDRLRKLVGQRAAAPAELIKATGRVQQAREKLQKTRLALEPGRVEVSRRALELVERDYAVKHEELAMKRAIKQGDVETARMELANLELERKLTVIRAPIDGIVTMGDVRVGDLLESGKPVVEIAEQRGFRFEVAVPSEEVAHLRLGMPARVRLDAYDYQRYGTLTGTVCFISPDSDLSKGQRTASYLVKIAVEGEEVGRGELRGRIKLGMAGQAEIVTGHESVLWLLVRQIRQTISLG